MVILSLTLKDTTKAWTTNEWGSDRYAVVITGGTGAGQTMLIASNTSNTLTIDSVGWITVPDNTSTYLITSSINWAGCGSIRMILGGGFVPYYPTALDVFGTFGCSSEVWLRPNLGQQNMVLRVDGGQDGLTAGYFAISLGKLILEMVEQFLHIQITLFWILLVI